jgi:hypothetical protein
VAGFARSRSILDAWSWKSQGGVHRLPSHPASRLPSASVASPSNPAPTGVCVAHAEGYAAFFMRASDPQLSVIAQARRPGLLFLVITGLVQGLLSAT